MRNEGLERGFLKGSAQPGDGHQARSRSSWDWGTWLVCNCHPLHSPKPSQKTVMQTRDLSLGNQNSHGFLIRDSMRGRRASPRRGNAKMTLRRTSRSKPTGDRHCEEGTGLPQESEISECLLQTMINTCIHGNAQKIGDLGRKPGPRRLGSAVVEALRCLHEDRERMCLLKCPWKQGFFTFSQGRWQEEGGRRRRSRR